MPISDGKLTVGMVQHGKTGQTCRICGCTNNDCRQCITKTGFPCYWVEADLCSACVKKPNKDGASLKALLP